jgi:hypothetical protein
MPDDFERGTCNLLLKKRRKAYEKIIFFINLSDSIEPYFSRMLLSKKTSY